MSGERDRSAHFHWRAAAMIYARDGVDGDLVALAMHLLHGRVVGVLVRHEKGGLDVAAVGVLAAPVEQLLVQLDVVVVNGVVEGDGDHLRHFGGGKVPGDRGSILRAEAVGQHAHGRVTWRRTVRVVVIVCTKTKQITFKLGVEFQHPSNPNII